MEHINCRSIIQSLHNILMTFMCGRTGGVVPYKLTIYIYVYIHVYIYIWRTKLLHSKFEQRVELLEVVP
jgi:hypothetical protein